MLSRQRKRFEERPKYSDPLEITTENGLALETEASSGALREYIRTE